jgi:hypothetical protein
MRGQWNTKDDTTLAGLMPAVSVHPEITAVPINASSQPDMCAIGYRATR